ncbi:MAG: hypothetical protein AB7P49_00020 [Bdellovibrionales bacterium]
MNQRGYFPSSSLNVYEASDIYRQIDRVAELPDVAIAIERTVTFIMEGGVWFKEKGVRMEGPREKIIHEFTIDLLRSLLKYNAVAYVLNSNGFPRVLCPGVDGTFTMDGSSVDGYTAAWMMIGSDQVDASVRVISFNPTRPAFTIVSCVSCLIPYACFLEEITENLLAADHSNSYTEYAAVLKNGSLIASETPVLRGSPADARSSVSNLIGQAMRAQTNGRTVDVEALVSKMQTIMETIRAQQPAGRVLHRVGANTNGTSEIIRRPIPGASALPLVPGFAIEPVHPISRNPQYMELRSNMWIASVSAAFGIPPTRLFGNRGPWDSGNVNQNAANTQVEAAYRTQINRYRDLANRVFDDIDVHGRAAAITNEIEWNMVSNIFQSIVASANPDELLSPYLRHMKATGSFRNHASLLMFQTQSETEFANTWQTMINQLAIEIQKDAESRGVALDLPPILEYLKKTRASEYNNWIMEYMKQKFHGDDGLEEKLNPPKTGASGSDDAGGMATEGERNSVVFPKLFEIFWNREPGMANMLLSLIAQGYVNKREGMRTVLTSLGFTDEVDIERLLTGVGTSRTPSAMETEEEEEHPPKLENPYQIPFQGPVDVGTPGLKQV